MENNQNISPEELEAIESYVHNNMMPDEQAEFEARLSADTSLQAKVSELQLLMTGVSEAVLQEKMNEFHKALPAKEKVHYIGKQTSPLKTWLVAASVLVIASVAGWLLLNRQNGEEKLFAEYFKPDSGLITAMSAGVDNYAFEKAMIDYKKGDYSLAIKVWDSLQKIYPASDTLNYFLGVAYLANGNETTATPYLKKVAALPQSFFKQDAFWYAGLSLLKEGKKEEATRFIQQSTHNDKDKLLQALKE